MNWPEITWLVKTGCYLLDRLFALGIGDLLMRSVRDLWKSSADIVVLSVLADGPKYGYAITKQVDAKTDSEVKLGPGVLYPLLHQMEKQGFVKAEWETIKAETGATGKGRKRKWYKLTAKGRKRLQQRAEVHRTHNKLIESFLRAAK